MVIVRLAVAVMAFGVVQSLCAAEPGGAIARLEQQIGGRLGVAALEMGSGRRMTHCPNERFPMCSTFKFLAVAAVLHRVDEKTEKLDRFISYTAADILEYAPVTKKHLPEGKMTVGALCEAALQMSDNTAANLLLTTLDGPAGLTRYIRSLGDKTTRSDRNEPTLNTALPGDERDTTTPMAMLEDMQRILLGKALSPASRDQLETWMRGNKTGAAQIRAGLPDNWKVGDKTGRGANGGLNDIAIIRPSKCAPILLTVYSIGSTAPVEKRMAAVASVAKLVAESF